MPIFGRRRKPDSPAPPPKQPQVALPSGEEVARSADAVLVQGKAAIKGVLFLTNRRLVFEAKSGDARYMTVPFSEVKASGVYVPPATTMGRPGARQPCLFIETDKGEHVWWSFARNEEDEWLAIVRERVAAATADRHEE